MLPPRENLAQAMILYLLYVYLNNVTLVVADTLLPPDHHMTSITLQIKLGLVCEEYRNPLLSGPGPTAVRVTPWHTCGSV